jgi:hypothetical protein
MKNTTVLLLISLLFFSISDCKKNIDSQHSLKFDTIHKEVEIIETKKIEGYPIGSDLNRGEVYIVSGLKASRKFLIKIVNIHNGEIKRRFEINAGDFRSPTEFYNPSHVQYVNGSFYVMDQFEKFVVFDEDLNYSYSSMFHEVRKFVDIFYWNNNIYFLIGLTKKDFKSIYNAIEIFQLKKNKKPIHFTGLYKSIDYPSILSTYKKKKTFNKGYFWPSIRGFEKDGSIYFSTGLDRKLHIYNLESKTRKVFELLYLTPHQYKEKDAKQIGYYKSGGWEEKLKKEHNTEVLYVAFPGKLYHFGIYDLDSNRIGIVSGLDLENMMLHIDIIQVNLNDLNYIESINLPFSTGFIRSIAHNSRDFVKTCIDTEKCIYVWLDPDEQEDVEIVKITRFKIK